MSINLKPDEVKLHPSFASIFHLTDDTTGHFVGAFALTAIGTAHSAGVKGYAFCQEAPDFITCPFVLHRRVWCTPGWGKKLLKCNVFKSLIRPSH